jgi:hypothetical protein
MGPFHLSLTGFFRILGRTTKQDFSLHIDLLNIPYGMLYRISRTVFLVRRLIHIFGMVHPLLDRRTCLRYLFVHLNEYSLRTSSGVLQTHRHLAVM